MVTNDIFFHILPGEKGDVGEIVLNRPKALNALSLSMCEALYVQLIRWEQDKKIKAVIIRGEGGRAFCAGGDVRSLYQHRNEPDVMMNFFHQEYRMNQAIFHFTKPYISLLDGITMGGGAGISIHGSHRVASEFFSFAMPETAIGFFPDVGAGYFLNRCPKKTGYYLGLTGDTIELSDAVALGLVNHFVKREQLPDLITALCAADFSDCPLQHVSRLISEYHFSLGETQLMQHVLEIEDCFSGNDIASIFKKLHDLNNDWSKKVIATLKKRSPKSLAVTLCYLQRAATLNFNEIMQLDLHLAGVFMQNADFFEGVRALLIDKDQSPKWSPATIEELNDGQIEKMFFT